MFNENLNDFVDLQAAEQQFTQATGYVKAFAKEMADANKNIKLRFDNLGNASSLSDIVKNTRAASENSKTLSVSLNGLTESYQKVNVIMSQMNDHSGEYLNNLKKQEQADKTAAQAATESAKQRTETARQATEASKQQTEQNKRDANDFITFSRAETEESKQKANAKIAASREATEASKQEANASLATARSATEAAKQKKLELDYTVALTKEKERLERAGEREQARLERLNSEYGQLNAKYNDAARLAQNLGARQFVLQEEVKSGTNVQVNNTELARLGPQLAEAQASAKKLGDALLTIDQAVGRSQRNVGNYNSATFAMTQILREAPSFAYNFATGLLAISNNLPILIDEIEKLNAVNRDLVAAGAKPVSVLKTLGAAVFSLNGIVTLAFAAITILTARLSENGAGMSEAEKAAKKYKEELRDLQYQIRETYEAEIQKSNDLFAVAKDLGSAYNVRIEAIDKLIKLYPDLLKNMEQEALLTGRSAAEQDRITSIIAKKSQTEELKKRIEILTKQRDEIQKNLEDYAPTGFGATYRGLKEDITGQSDIKDKQNAIAKLNADLADAAQLLGIVTKEMDYLAHPKHDGRILEDIKADIQAQENLRDTTVQGSQAHTDSIATLKKLNEEMDIYLGKEKKEKDKSNDDQYKSDLDSIKKEHELRIKELEIEAEKQKEITEDETRTLVEKLEASKKYSDLKLETQNQAYLSEGEQTARSLQEIERIEKLSNDKRADWEKQLFANKENFLKEYDIVFAGIQLNQEKGTKSKSDNIIKIENDEVQKRLDMVQLLNNNVDIQEGKALQDLNDKYKKGEINYADYSKRREGIEAAFQALRLSLTKEYLAAEINLLKVIDPTINVTKLQEALDKIIAQIGKLPVKNNSKNPFWAALGLTDEQGKQAEQLANQAIEFEQAISKAVDQRYQNEITNLEHKKQLIQDNYNADVTAIQKSFQSQQAKDVALGQLAAQKAADDKKINEDILKQKRKMAQNDKVASIAEAIEKGAVAVINALDTQPVWLGIALAAGIGATVAARVATISNTPLPQYKTGAGPGMGNPIHPGGKAILGDGYKREMVIEPGKAPYWSEATPTVYDLKPHTQVIPEADYLANNLAFSKPSISGQVTFNSDYTILANAIREDGQATRSALANMPQTTISMSNGEWRKSVRRGNSFTKYLNSNF